MKEKSVLQGGSCCQKVSGFLLTTCAFWLGKMERRKKSYFGREERKKIKVFYDCKKGRKLNFSIPLTENKTSQEINL